MNNVYYNDLDSFVLIKTVWYSHGKVKRWKYEYNIHTVYNAAVFTRHLPWNYHSKCPKTCYYNYSTNATSLQWFHGTEWTPTYTQKNDSGPSWHI